QHDRRHHPAARGPSFAALVVRPPVLDPRRPQVPERPGRAARQAAKHRPQPGLSGLVQTSQPQAERLVAKARIRNLAGRQQREGPIELPGSLLAVERPARAAAEEQRHVLLDPAIPGVLRQDRRHSDPSSATDYSGLVASARWPGPVAVAVTDEVYSSVTTRTS